MRADREDVTAQAERVDAAVLEVKAVLADVAATAKRAMRTLNLNSVYAEVSKLRRAEEALDIAHLDLDTARGDDA